MTEVFIQTMNRDSHTVLVAAALAVLGVPYRLFSTTDIVGRGDFAVTLDGDSATLLQGEHEPFVISSATGTFWHRRSGSMLRFPNNVHEADKPHIRRNVSSITTGLSSLLDDSLFSVNPIVGVHVTSNKLRQINIAAAAGLSVPKTLVTNRFESVVDFQREQGTICVKATQVGSWHTSDGSVSAMTTVMRGSLTEYKESVELMPCIYQPYVAKAFEVRLTVFAKVAIATKINSQDHGDSTEDWRGSYSYLKNIESIEAPDHIAESCRRVLCNLGLRFGTFDFIVRPSGEWVFLEVNEGGQFIWQEQYCEGVSIIEPFARYLATRDDQFKWDPTQASDELGIKNLDNAWRQKQDLNEFMHSVVPDVSEFAVYREDTVPGKPESAGAESA